MRVDDIARKIRVIVLDCDGVLTDGGLYYDNEGNVSKRFDVQDGLGIKVAQEAGIIIAVITGLESTAVKTRVESLKIVDYFAGHLDKMDCLQAIREKYACEWEEMAYIGDDWVDLAPMKAVGLPVAVANAQPEVKSVAKLITTASGGHGAVRESISLVLRAQGKLKAAMSRWTD